MTDPTTHEAAPTRPFHEEVREAMVGDNYSDPHVPLIISSGRFQVLIEAARQWLAFTDAAKPVCDELEGKGP